MNPDDRFVWVAGLYYEHARQQDTVFVSHPDLPALVQAIYGQSIESILGTGPYQGLWVAFDDVRTRDEQTALFANVDYKIAPTLKATVGVRVAYAKSHTDLHFDGSFNGGPGFFNGDETDKPVTPKAGLTWQPTSSSTYYVSVSKGYRVGGVNPADQQHAARVPGGAGRRRSHRQAVSDLQPGLPVELRDRRQRAGCSTTGSRFRRADSTSAGRTSSRPRRSPAADLPPFSTSERRRATASTCRCAPRRRTIFSWACRLRTPMRTTTASEGKIVTDGDVIGGPAISTGSAVPPWTADRERRVHVQSAWKAAVFLGRGLLSQQEQRSLQHPQPGQHHRLRPGSGGRSVDQRAQPAHRRSDCRALDVSLFVDNVLNSHPQLSLEHTNPGDPRFQAVTFGRSRTASPPRSASDPFPPQARLMLVVSPAGPLTVSGRGTQREWSFPFSSPRADRWIASKTRRLRRRWRR